MITPGGADTYKAYVDSITAVGQQYRDLLTGQLVIYTSTAAGVRNGSRIR
jgi:hypothetical protein